MCTLSISCFFCENANSKLDISNQNSFSLGMWKSAKYFTTKTLKLKQIAFFLRHFEKNIFSQKKSADSSSQLKIKQPWCNNLEF